MSIVSISTIDSSIQPRSMPHRMRSRFALGLWSAWYRLHPLNCPVSTSFASVSLSASSHLLHLHHSCSYLLHLPRSRFTLRILSPLTPASLLLISPSLQSPVPLIPLRSCAFAICMQCCAPNRGWARRPAAVLHCTACVHSLTCPVSTSLAPVSLSKSSNLLHMHLSCPYLLRFNLHCLSAFSILIP